MEKVDLQNAPDSRSWIQRGLEDPSWKDGRWSEWAFSLAGARAPELVVPALRTRLDRDESRARLWHQRVAEQDAAQGATTMPFEATLSGSPHVAGVFDFHFDDALVLFAQMDGGLNDLEKRRLTTFGYLGDPQQQLQQRNTFRSADR